MPRGESMWLWFRLEGDLTYVTKQQSRQEIFLVVGYGPEQAVLDDFISLKSINRSAARMEAEIPANNGHFDWRVDGYKSAFFVPGTYYFELAQGQSRICFLTEDIEGCRLTVTVK